VSREDFEHFEEHRRLWRAQKETRRSDWAEKVASGQVPGVWVCRHDTHWQTTLLGDLLDYWPGTKKWRWRGQTRTGDVIVFIRNRSEE
jgi:hypothetical protein